MKPTLLVLAAGMGSRYGGVKQIDAVGMHNETLLDFGVFDAKNSGYGKVVFIIRKDIEKDFRERLFDRIARNMDAEYVFQSLDSLLTAEELAKSQGRAKPWGTIHALLCAKDAVKTPFTVVNADDYYGRDAFQVIYDYLATHEDDDKYRYTMVGYKLENTVTDNGHVARGVCDTNEAGELVRITERTRIEKRNGGIAYSEDDGASWTELPGDTLVSMNMWGFTRSILDEIKAGFPAFLEKGLVSNPMKCEYFLPAVVSTLLEEGRATVAVLASADKWYGVTYKEDKPVVVQAIKKMKAEGRYPEKLWGEA